MRVAVISDIHGNLHALQAVLAAIDDDEVDSIWCLGDVVGYGPRPNECCELVAERARLCLAGNHDLAVVGAVDVAEFNGDAGAAVLWTRGVLDESARAFLERNRPSAREPGVELFHASARDPVWEYVLSDDLALASLRATSEPLVLVGHSHVALAVALDGDAVAGGVAGAGQEADLSELRWLLNPGSVGQPRDGDPRAAYLLLDLRARAASFRRIAYPIERTQAEMREQGLPPMLAARLLRGE
jgi:predicted phosphodiesterase